MSTHTYGGGIDPTAIIGHAPESRDWRPEHGTAGVLLAHGVRVEAYVTIDSGIKQPTRIGANTWLLKGGTHVGHDAQIGERCEICCGAKIGGHAVIEDDVQIGLNATVLPYRKVGKGARVGAGAVVTKDVNPGVVVVGNPARPLVKSEDFGPKCCGKCACAEALPEPVFGYSE